MNHKSELDAQYFTLVANGIKKYEIRILDQKREIIRVGDIWIFRNASQRNNTIKVRVVSIEVFTNFHFALSGILMIDVLGEEMPIDNAVQLYESIKGYKEKLKEYRKVARFGIELIELIE